MKTFHQKNNHLHQGFQLKEIIRLQDFSIDQFFLKENRNNNYENYKNSETIGLPFYVILTS